LQDAPPPSVSASRSFQGNRAGGSGAPSRTAVFLEYHRSGSGGAAIQAAPYYVNMNGYGEK